MVLKHIAMMDEFVPGPIPNRGLGAELEADHVTVIIILCVLSSLPLRSLFSIAGSHCAAQVKRRRRYDFYNNAGAWRRPQSEVHSLR